jgi:crotonobetainyl-CoA:carnitine CoA-transferase CaiB-like acyl-CoA transferase
MFKLLDGVRVLEAAVLFNGDNVGMLLGDLGADVIKIESVGRGDYLRDFLGQIVPHCSPAHLQVNKNKRSLELDVRKPEGRAIFFDLLKTADIFIDGFAGDACAEMGIGYEAQRKVKPDIVYVQYSGYGASGPYASIPTHGRQMNALVGGIPAAMGEDGFIHRTRGAHYMGGTEDSGPGPSQGAPYAALAALQQRQRTGKGAYIDVAASDAVLTSSWIGATYAFNYDRIRAFVGLSKRTNAIQTDEGGGSARYQLYETKDARQILFCGIEPKFWTNFCKAIGRDDLLRIDDSAPVDFGSGDHALRREMQAIFRTRTQAEWTALAAAHDIAMGPSHRLEDVPDDPHVKSRGVVAETEHPAAGPFTTLGFPARIGGEGNAAPAPAPALGQHTEEILAELGIGPERIAALRAARVIGAAKSD